MAGNRTKRRDEKGARGDAPSTREEILAAAAEVLLRRGLSDSSLRAIGDEIGVSARMLVYHFESKELFFREIFEVIREREQGWIGQMFSNTHAKEQPSALLERAWRQINRPEYLRIVRLYLQVAAEESMDPEAYGGLTERSRDQWSALIQGFVAARSIPEEAQEGLSSLIFSTLRGIQLDAAAVENTARNEAAIRVLGSLLDDFDQKMQSDPREPTPPRARTSASAVRRAQKEVDRLRGAQSWLEARVVVFDEAAERLTLALDRNRERARGGIFHRDVVEAFVQLSARAHVSLFGLGDLAGTAQVDLLDEATARSLEASSSRASGPAGSVIDVRLEGATLVALGRARLR